MNVSQPERVPKWLIRQDIYFLFKEYLNVFVLLSCATFFFYQTRYGAAVFCLKSSINAGNLSSLFLSSEMWSASPVFQFNSENLICPNLHDVDTQIRHKIDNKWVLTAAELLSTSWTSKQRTVKRFKAIQCTKCETTAARWLRGRSHVVFFLNESMLQNLDGVITSPRRPRMPKKDEKLHLTWAF